jgi:hypothetical protein
MRNREAQEQYKFGYDDERQYLNNLMMDRGLKQAIKQADADRVQLVSATNPYEVGLKHAAEEWVNETKWMAKEGNHGNKTTQVHSRRVF